MVLVQDMQAMPLCHLPNLCPPPIWLMRRCCILLPPEPIVTDSIILPLVQAASEPMPPELTSFTPPSLACAPTAPA